MKTTSRPSKRLRKRKTANRDKWTLIVLSLISLAIATYVIVTLHNAHPHPKWPLAAARLNKVAFGRSGGRRYDYTLNGVIYQGWTGSGYDVREPGDIHLVRYNPTDTSESEWISDRTYFVLGDSLRATTARVRGKWSHRDSLSYVRFEYEVAGDDFQRSDCISPDDASKFVVGRKYYIQYVIHQPYRSKLVLPARAL